MKKIGFKLLKKLSMLSFGIAVLSANSASTWFIHQPKEPKELEQLKKRKQVKSPVKQGRFFVFKEIVCLFI